MKTSDSLVALATAAILSACGPQSVSPPSTPPSVSSPSAAVTSSATTNPVAVTTPAAVQEVVDPAAPRAPLPQDRATAVGTSVNGLASAMYARLASTPGNLVFSPASIHAAFAMTTLGARGETATELQRMLSVPTGNDTQLRDEGELLQAWNAPHEHGTLRVVNRLFGERTMHFEDPYLATLRASFASPLEPTDFQQDFEASRVHINAWVATSTEQRILDLLPPASLTSSTRLVLVNAIYLDAQWADPFEVRATSNAPFTVAPGRVVSVPTMHQRGRVQTATVDGARIVELPYEGNGLAMRFILPPAGHEDAWVSAANLATPTWVQEEINLSLPKFRFEPSTSTTLSTHLRAMGVRQAFDENEADFTGIATFPDPERRLYISEAFHRAFIRVDEAGTEAAAATAIVMMEGGGMPRPVPDVRFDRPFLFQLVDVSSGATLFLGRVAQPSAN